MKRMLFFPLLILFMFPRQELIAQSDGSITPHLLQSLRSSLPGGASNKALMNAVAGTDVKTLAVDRNTAIAGDQHFTHRIKTSGITNQKKTGRCWLFAGLNIMRPGTAALLQTETFTFSHNYPYFYDKLEKANLFLESIIRIADRPLDDRDVQWLLQHPLPDGGQWNMVVALIEKYGVVPTEIMPETYSSSNSGSMNTAIKTKLVREASILRRLHEEGAGSSELRNRKQNVLEEVYRMLAMHLGVPPERFVWRREDKNGNVFEPVSYSPLEFTNQFVRLNLDDYVCLHHVPNYELNSVYTIRFDRNVFDRPDMLFANLPMEQLREFTLKSVLADEPVWFGCDVGKDSDRKKGWMKKGLYDYESIYDVELTMSKADRIAYGLGVPSHAMAITGVDMIRGKPVKWLVENSWGSSVGKDGMFVMDDAWFVEYTYSVIIHKRFLPENVLDILKQTPTELPPWDPMYDMW